MKRLFGVKHCLIDVYPLKSAAGSVFRLKTCPADVLHKKLRLALKFFSHAIKNVGQQEKSCKHLSIKTFQMPDFILYGTSACHLCEQAKELLQQSRIEFETIDIMEDSALSDRLGWFIPVLHHRQTKTELNWPFNLKDMRQFISQAELISCAKNFV